MMYKAARASDTAISESLYLGGAYGEVLDFLCSPVTGFANVKVLVSEPGLGKTVLLRSAIDRVKSQARTASVFWTRFNPQEFIAYLLFAMGSREPRPPDLNAAQVQFENVLRRAAADGKRFVLAIDEAHNLSPGTFKSLSALLDRDTAAPPQTTVLLAGLPRLHDRLADPAASGIRERIVGVRTIAPLNERQAAEYIRERMSVFAAGPVAPEKLAHIAADSGGVPRMIDALCRQVAQNESGQQRTQGTSPADTRVNNESFITRTEIRQLRAQGAPPPDTPAHEKSSITGQAIMRVAAWATGRPGTWSGTVAELANATGISMEEISDVIENRTQELHRAGVTATVRRLSGRPRMITLSPVEREQAPESHVSIPELGSDNASSRPEYQSREAEAVRGLDQAPESHVLIPELFDEDAAPKPEYQGQEVEAVVGLDQAPESQVPIPELFEDDAGPETEYQGQELQAGQGLEQSIADDTGLHWAKTAAESDSKNRLSAWSSRAAIFLAVIMTMLGGLLYLGSRASAHHGSSVSQRVLGAKAGEAISPTALADRYREGNGVPRDEKLAMALYERAATEGDPVAQQKLGLALSSGSSGLVVDRVAAYTWLALAQSGGQAIDQATLDSLTRRFTPGETREARYRLGLMYARGIGCVPDLVLADQWFLLGAAVGDTRSRGEVAALERRMSRKQISQAHAQSNDWLRHHTAKGSNAR